MFSKEQPGHIAGTGSSNEHTHAICIYFCSHIMHNISGCECLKWQVCPLYNNTPT